MSRKRLLQLGCAAALVALVGAVALLLSMAKPWALRYAVGRARDQGVVLSPTEIELGLGSVTLRESSFELAGLPAIRGRIRRLDVSLRGWTPVALGLTGVEVEATGTAPALAVGVADWAKRHPSTFALPTEAQEVTLAWRPEPGAEPWLKLEGGRVQRSGATTAFTAERSLVGVCLERDEGAPRCPDLGKVGAAWTADAAQVSLALGAADLAAAPLRLEVRHALPQPTARLTLAPVELHRLAGPLGSKVPLRGVKASAAVDLALPPGSAGGPITGKLEASLQGYVPPHPRELDGFLFGDTTKLSAKLRLDDARERVDLEEVRLAAGAFSLAGSGTVARDGARARIRLDLAGDLPCSALAGAAADSALGRLLGRAPGELARLLVRGSVSVKVAVDVRSDALADATVRPEIGVGCGLRPLTVGGVDVGKILGGELPPLPSGFPPLPSALPPLPMGFPPLPGARPTPGVSSAQPR
ncbi:MAG: hypothetical protein IT376_07745 [Polyangiaceae bacterium]|nr:hypothetical protein [Polyangiaceae bacterium]